MIAQGLSQLQCCHDAHSVGLQCWSLLVCKVALLSKVCAAAGYSSGYSSGYNGYDSGYYYGDPGPASYTPVYNYYSSTPYYSNPGSYGYDTSYNNSALCCYTPLMCLLNA